MTETPTPDDLARWAAMADHMEEFGANRHCTSVEMQEADDCDEVCNLLADGRDVITRLLALVAAQAEQNAEHKWQLASAANAAFEAEHLPRELAAEPMVIAAVERAERAEAELSALRATDEYQRWAQAVTERDAAREAVARVAAVINDPARTWIIDTHNRDGTVDKRGREVVDSDDIRAALGMAT